MIHEVAADEAAAVGGALRQRVGRREKEQLGDLDGVRREHVESAGRRALDRALARGGILIGQVLDAGDPAVGVHENLVGHGLRHQGDVAGLQRVAEGDGGVVLGLDRADRRAVGVALAHAPALVGLGVAALGRRRDEDRQALEGGAVERAGEELVDDARRDAAHRELVAGAVGQPEDLVQRVLGGLVGGHTDHFFGFVVPRHQVGVGDRPVGLDAVLRPHFEVVGDQTQAGADPVPGGAASDPLSGAAEGQAPRLIGQVALVRIAPGGRGAVGQDERGRPRRVLERGVGLPGLLHRRRIGGFDHLGRRGVEALEIVVAVGRDARPGLA